MSDTGADSTTPPQGADLDQILASLSGPGWPARQRGVELLDALLAAHPSCCPGRVFEAVLPLGRILDDLGWEGAAPRLQRRVAGLLARMARLRSCNDPRTPEVLAPLVRLLRRVDGLSRRAEVLLERVGLDRNLVSNMYFVFRETEQHGGVPCAVRWIVQHGRAEGVLALVELMNEPDFSQANRALVWVRAMADRLLLPAVTAGLDLDFDFAYSAQQPRAAALEADELESLRFIYALSGVIFNAHRCAQRHRFETQVRFFQANAEAHLQDIVGLCRSPERLAAMVSAVARGHRMALRSFARPDPRLDAIAADLGQVVEHRARLLDEGPGHRLVDLSLRLAGCLQRVAPREPGPRVPRLEREESRVARPAPWLRPASQPG
jgi:hypothetical protein